MWTRENRGLYERKSARYPSDLRDAWALIAPLIPPAKRGGRRRGVDKRGSVIRCYTEDGDVARPGTTLRSWLPRAVLLGRIQPAGRY